MDSDDLVIIDSEPSMSVVNSPAALPQLKTAKNDVESDEEYGSNSHPIIHTNIIMRNGKYRYHNYLKDTNDNCAFCHDFLLQTYRERRFGAFPPPPPPLVVPVGCTGPLNVNSLNERAASTSSTATATATTAANANANANADASRSDCQ